MTFIPDGNSIDYDRGRGVNPATKFYAWGWVGHFVSNCNEWKDENQKQKFLQALFAIPVENVCRGSHDCDICGKVSISNGTRTLIINGYTFRCPAGVDHYINHHDYVPPQIVIDAFLSTSLTLGQASNLIVKDIIKDITDRAGMSNIWDEINSDIKKEIEDKWRSMTLSHIKSIDPRKFQTRDLAKRPRRSR